MKLIPALIPTVILLASFGAIGGGSLAAATCEEAAPAPSYTVTRSWVEGHYEREGYHTRWVPAHWVETRTPVQQVVVHHLDDDRGNWDRRREQEQRDRERQERERHQDHHQVSVTALPIPVPIPFPLPPVLRIR